MKPEPDPPEVTCGSLRGFMPAISSKWALPIVSQLIEGPKRFSDLKRALGEITQKSLTAALRDLERDGLLVRIVTPTIPPRVDYELTPVGYSVVGPAHEMAKWAVRHRQDIEQARARFATKS